MVFLTSESKTEGSGGTADTTCTFVSVQQFDEMKEENKKIIQDLKEGLDAVRAEFQQQDREDLVREELQQQRPLLSNSVIPQGAPEGGEEVNDPDMLYSIEEDTYSLMMLSKMQSSSWALGLIALVFQSILSVVIAYDQIALSTGSSVFNVPFTVKFVVRVGQFCCIIIALWKQDDTLTSVQAVSLLLKGSNWNEVIGEPEQKSTSLWLIRIMLPNLLKLLQSMLVMFISFVIIVQSDNIIDLLKDFTALMVLSETDNVLFYFAKLGYLGGTLKKKTSDVLNVKLRPPMDEVKNKALYFRALVILSLFILMFGGWLFIVMNQVNGKFFYDRYPKCDSTDDAFELANKHFGDGVCYGGPLNTLECAFEGGDCVNFNLAFPLCKGDEITNVEDKVGNGVCEEIFKIADCDYDGGDCCPNDITSNPSFGNGVCNGGVMNTPGCGYDDRDCLGFFNEYPDCPLDDLSKHPGADAVIIGDKLCDGGVYNTRECGYEFGDCNHGQVGQTVVTAVEIILFLGDRRIFISKTLSLDGTTMALYSASESSSDLMRGLVKIWKYSSDRKIWTQLGKDIDVDGRFGTVSLSANGSRINLTVDAEVQVYDFKVSSGDEEWTKVGQSIMLTSFDTMASLTADGSKVAVIEGLSSSNSKIRIYEFDENRQEWVNDDYNVINLNGLDGIIGQLEFNSLDGSTLLLNSGGSDRHIIPLLTRVYRFNATSPAWTQIGQDIETSTSTSISGNGNRIAVSFNSTSTAFDSFNSISTDAPGQVNVYDYDDIKNEWVLVGDPIKSSTSRNGDGFGFSVNMSSDGNLIVVGSNTPKCRDEYFHILFNIKECNQGYAELFNYNVDAKRFDKVIPNINSQYRNNGNILAMSDLSDSTSSGLQISTNGDGNVLSVSGYNADDEQLFVEVYDLDELFYTKCVVEVPDWIDNVWCNGGDYNTTECGWDGGDCL